MTITKKFPFEFEIIYHIFIGSKQYIILLLCDYDYMMSGSFLIPILV